MWGSCRWRDPIRRSLAWDTTCPLSCRTSTWTGCHSSSRLFVSWLLWGILMHFCETRTSLSRALDRHNLGLDTWRGWKEFNMIRGGIFICLLNYYIHLLKVTPSIVIIEETTSQSLTESAEFLALYCLRLKYYANFIFCPPTPPPSISFALI